MFETYLSGLCDRLHGVTDVAIVSYQGHSLAHHSAVGVKAQETGLTPFSPLLQQMKSGFSLMGLGDVSSINIEGPNQKVICWPINQHYLLCLAGDVTERDGRILFELSTVAAAIKGYF